MCKNAEIPFIYYDLETCSVTHLAVDEKSPKISKSPSIVANKKSMQ